MAKSTARTGAKQQQASRSARWRDHVAAAADAVRRNPGRIGMVLPPPEVEEVEVAARDLLDGDLIVQSRLRVAGVALRRDDYVDITIEEHDSVMHVGKSEILTVERIISDPPTPDELDSYLSVEHSKGVAARVRARHGVADG